MFPITWPVSSSPLTLQSNKKLRRSSLCKKCPYSELFWSVFSRIRTRITPNTDIFHALVISHKFNTWYGDRVSDKLKRSVTPGNVKVSLKMSENWKLKMYCYLKPQKGSILNGFDKTDITEAVMSAKHRENWKPFYRKTILVVSFLVTFFLMKKTIEVFKYMCLYCSYFLPYDCWLLFIICLYDFN